MHSTYISALVNHCAKAMKLTMGGERWIGPARLDLGVTSHAVQEACRGTPESQWMGIADSVVQRLCACGYKFDGQQQPPLNLEEAQRGAALGLAWLRQHGAEPEHAQVELGLAIDKEGKACDYSDGYYQKNPSSA